MTENVLSNILESLSLDDAAAANDQITEWFDSVIQENALGFYVLESDDFMDSAGVWGFVSREDAEKFVELYSDGGGDYGVRIIDASEVDELPKSLAPAGCLDGITSDDLAVWMQDHGANGAGFAIATLKPVDETIISEPDFTIGENVVAEENTIPCGECGEVDPSMDPEQEFCDQCIAEANARHPDLMADAGGDEMINVSDIVWRPTSESVDVTLDSLLEEFKGLQDVKSPENKEGKLIGDGESVSVEDHSPTPNVKASKRVTGQPVEVMADEHSGFDLEPAPSIKDIDVDNLAPKAELEEIPADGNKDAILNKKDEEGNTVSPLGSKPRD